jgi:ADP-heptose:LPS heptosyltransferase
MNPVNILLIKSHSMGVGDLLRSSAAWSALKNRWPNANLHLLMLSKHAGYASEEFIRSHHLLASASFITVRSGHPGQTAQRNLSISTIYKSIEINLKDVSLDLVIDFEPYGVKTALLSRWISRRKNAKSIGIAQFPLRRYFYSRSAPSVTNYVRDRGLNQPMDYTERDFVVLDALGIRRDSTQITLSLSGAALGWQKNNPISMQENKKIVVLNIGCGTLDALSKRPELNKLADCLVALYSQSPFQLHLSGANFEKKINEEFQAILVSAMQQNGYCCDIYDWSGQPSLTELPGLLAKANLVVSSDSGPYHMAVALGVPTLCWFNFDTPASYHHCTHVQTLILPSCDQFVQAATCLIRYNSNE